MLHNDIVKISEILNKWNMLKTCIQTTYPIDFRIFCGQVYYGKKWTDSIVFKTVD